MAAGNSPSIRGFDPRNVPGCALWLDAADASTISFSSGSNVSAWRDKSSNAFSGTGIASPLYQTNSLNGLPGINFNGSSHYFNFGNVLNLGTNPIYIFAVCTYSSTADGAIVGKTSYRGYVSRWALNRSAVDGGIYMLIQNNESATTYPAYANTSTSPQLLNGYWDRSAVYGFLNGVQRATAASASTANFSGTDRMLVGAYGDAAGTGAQTGYFFPGNMYEILIYTNTIATSQRQQIEGYLAHKWGLNTELGYAYTSVAQSPPTGSWTTITMSANGQNSVATTYNTGTTTPVYTTSNGGTSWSVASSYSDPSTLAMAASDDGTKIALATNGTVLAFSSNSGASFSTAVNAVTWRGICCTPNGTIWYGVTLGQFYKSLNSGVTWTTGASGISGTSMYGVTCSSDGTVVYVVNASGSIHKSINSGTSFTSVYNNSSSNLNGIKCSPDGSIVIAFAVGYSSYVSGLVISRDSGATWTSPSLSGIALGGSTIMGWCSSNGKIWYVAGSTLYKSTDSAATWTPISSLGTGFTSVVCSGDGTSLLTVQSSTLKRILYTSTQPFALVRPFTRAFQPIDIPGCALWLDAADGSTVSFSSGSNVSVWKDKSGNGYSMTANLGTPTLATNSLNSMNSVYTASGVNMKISTFALRTNFTIFFVGQAATGKYLFGLGNGCIYLGNDSLLYLQPPSGNYLDVYDGTIALGTSVVSANTPFLFCIGYDNVNSSNANPYSINGSTRTTRITPRGTPGILADQTLSYPFYVNSINGTNTYDTVNTGEILVFNTALNPTQRQQIEGYLGWKWGLNAQLPGVPLNPKWQSGLALWLDAADPLGTGTPPANGATITTWVDKSGNGYNATAQSAVTYATGQQNGLGTINLGTNTGSLTGTISQPITNTIMSCFFVFKLNGTSTDNGIHSILDFADPTATYDLRVLEERNGSFRFITRNPATVGISTAAVTGSYAIWFSGQDGSNMYARLNGTSLTSQAISTNPRNSSQYIIGGNFEAATPTGWNGYVAEQIVIRGLVSQSTQQGIETYLARKWGLTVPTSTPHPFFRLPASTTTSYTPLIPYSQVLPFHWTTSWSPYLSALTAANSGVVATETVGTNMGATLPGGFAWIGGVLAPNGKIYSVPFDPTTILEINTNVSPATATNFGSLSGSAKWAGGVLAPNGKIYGVPHNATTILVIDPSATTPTATTFGTVAVDGDKYWGGVLGPNGKIYCVPRSATSILIIDPTDTNPATALTYITGIASGGDKWRGGVLGPDGNIYYVPFNAGTVLKINTITNAVTYIGSGLTAGGWNGGALAPNGKIYCAPQDAQNVLVIDPAGSGSVSFVGTGLGTGTAKWGAAVLAPNGKIYCVPRGATSILVIDPAGVGSVSFVGTFGSGNKWLGGVLAPNGTIYGVPTTATTILQIQTNVAVDSGLALSPYFNKL